MGDTTQIQTSAVESAKPLPFYGDDKSSTIECAMLSEDRTKFTHVFSLPYKEITSRQHGLACVYLSFARTIQDEAVKYREMATQTTDSSQKKPLLLQARILEISAVCLTDVATNIVVTDQLSVDFNQAFKDCFAFGAKQGVSEFSDAK